MSGGDTLVDSETGEIALPPDDIRLSWQPMTEDQARKVTTDIKTYATRLCHLVRDAKTGQAWTPLGYDTWGEYVETEFGMSRQRAQQLIDHANKLDLTAEVVELASPPAAAITERATRGLKADDLRSALVAAMEESPAELTEAERLVVANKAIDTLRKAKAAASTAVDAVTAKTSDGEPTPSSDAPEQGPQIPAPASDPGGAGAEPPTVAAADPVSTEAPEAGAGNDGGQAVSATAPPAVTLADDWRDDVAHAAYLLRHDARLLAAAIDADDRADLQALHDHLTAVLAEQEQTE